MLNHITAGKGNKQIIFIHGNSQSAEAWLDVFADKKLSDNYKLIAVDLPGHGKSFRSTDQEQDYSLKHLAKQLLEFLKEINADDYILVGNSLGANIIGEAALHLNNCKGIMITSSCAFGKGLSLEEIFLPNPNSAGSFMPTPSIEEINALVNDTVFNVTEEKKDQIRKAYINTDPNFRLYIANSLAPAEHTDELQNLEDSGVPLAFVFGEEEKLCNIHHLDKTGMQLWKGQAVLVKNSGHFSHIDQPEKLAELIKDFADDCLV